MNQPLIFTLPLPPSINAQYATVNGRRVLSKEARLYKQTVAEWMMIAGGLPHFPSDVTEMYIVLFIACYFTSPLRRDLDGGLKILIDAVCGALGINDNRVVDLHVVKRVDKAEPRVELVVSLVGEWNWVS